MRRRVVGVLCVTLCVLAWPLPAAAQGGSTASSLTGRVVDSGGGVVPGATVVVTNIATKTTFNTVTGSTGTFSVPSLDPGTYTVTVSLSGFKTAVITDVRLLAGRPAEVSATLEIGTLTDTVEVRGGTELIQTQSATISSTISAEQVNNLPLVSRNALNFVVFLPGVSTTGGPRGSTISGLPQNTINISLDGINVSNNLQSGDGFFSMVVPSVDAIEEVSVTTATQGADAAGQGATQIKFVTRSGTNEYATSVYHYLRHPSLNSNYFFNEVNDLDKNSVVLHQFGGRIGGPIRVPGFDGRGKAFFFFNYEQFYQPTEITRSRTLLNPDAQRGVYSYLSSGAMRQVDLLALAAANGQTSTADPTIAAVLAQIRAGAESTGNITTAPNATNAQDYIYQAPSRGDRYFPTTRVDLNLSTSHRLSGTYYWQRFVSTPDILNSNEPNFPGLPNFGDQTSYRTTGSATLRSTMSSTMVNEIKAGWQWSPVEFFTNVTAAQFENQGLFSLGFPLVTSPSTITGPSARNTVNWSVDDTVSLLRGNHAWTLGGSFTQINHDQNNWTVVPSIGFGVETTNDPANAMFTTANFPGASTAALNDARNLYALITGRVTNIGGTGRLSADTNEYVYNGRLNQKSLMREFGLFAQDSWRLRPNLTLNFGARWELQLPFTPVTTNWSKSSLPDLCGISGVGAGVGGRQCNLFQPGFIPAPDAVPQYVQYTPGDPGYRTDWNNVAPNVGIAWRPGVEGGWLRALLGDPDQATLRAGFSVSYNRPRMDEFTGLFGGNPGGTTPATRDDSGIPFPLVGPGETWPVLFRDSARLGPPDFATTPAYPIVANLNSGNDIRIFDPDLEVPYTQSWSLSFQRSLSRDMAVEVRYVGNRNMSAWTDENWNELVLHENGFLDEFKAAQQNLLANMAAGRGSTFRYAGPGTGTSPLPTYLAFFSGVPVSQSGDASRYSSSNFTNSAWTGHLGQYEPDPVDAANDLWNNAGRRTNAEAAGIPLNHFVLNPHVDDAVITKSLAGSRYHSMQVELRRRLSRGLTVQGSYAYQVRFGSSLETLRRDRVYLRSADVPHAMKMTWVYEIPFGRGRRFGTDTNAWMNATLGNWEFSGTGRLQVRDFILDNVRVVGMSERDLRDAFEIRIERDPASGTTTVWNMPQDIIDNTRRAFNTSPTSPDGYGAEGPPTGRYLAPASLPGCVYLYYGDCGTSQVRVGGPLFSRFDFRLKKSFPFAQKASVELNLEVLNVFDAVNFNPAFNPGGGDNVFRVTSAYTDINTTQDPGGRIGQIVWRISW